MALTLAISFQFLQSYAAKVNKLVEIKNMSGKWNC